MKLNYAVCALLATSACGHSNGAADRGNDEPQEEGLIANSDGWWRGATFYEIFVRSFADSNGDGVGDFVGMTQKLDYLNDGDPNTTTDLGVNGIWLMPINASPSYHGYDVTDYQALNAEYGTMEEFEAFITAAHERGIKVIMDFVLNHGSSQHPYFRAAAASPDAPERDYFMFRDELPTEGYRRPWDGGDTWHALNGDYYYGIFWGGMPDWNLANPDVETMMFDAMKFWMSKGVDGFRVDAIRYLMENEQGQVADLPETHAFVKKMRAEIAKDYPQVLFVGEVWTDSSKIGQYYGEGDELQLAFSFDLAGKIISSANDGLRADLNQILRITDGAFRSDQNFQAPFLTNHDMRRVMGDLNGDAGAMRVAAATLFAMPGTPFLYYGEEIGMVGGPSAQDEDKRTPMRWEPEVDGQFGFTTASPWRNRAEAEGVDVASQTSDPDSLLSLYRQLIGLRNSSAALNDGEISQPTLAGGGRGTTAVLREKDGSRVLYVVNFDRSGTDSPVVITTEGAPTVLFGEGLQGTPSTDGTSLTLDGIDAQGFVFLQLE